MAIVYRNKEYRNLQEQVLENAKDIEILKAKPTMRVSVVDELPEVGDPTIIYLVPSEDGESPNVYEEYVWLEDEERYEMIGTTDIDLSNMVTTDTEQTITGEKTFSSDLNVQGDVNVGTDVVVDGKVVIGATGYDIKKDSTNLVIEADGNPVKVRGDLLPNSGSTYTLGNASTQWKTLFLSHYVTWGNNAYIYKDSSNRLVFVNGGNDIIKVGQKQSNTYIASHLVPDQDNLSLNLGASNMRWSVGYINSIENDYGALQLRARAAANPWITLDTNNTSEVGGIAPASDQSAKLGNAGKKFLTTYTRYINDDNVNIAVSDIATKPDYANPDVWASGKLASGTGSATIDYTEETGVGLPEWGLYMFTYGNAQCYVAFTESMWLGILAGYPIRVACPCLEESGGTVEGNTGNLKIEKTSTTGVIKVTVASTITGSATSTNGWDFQFIKVM